MMSQMSLRDLFDANRGREGERLVENSEGTNDDRGRSAPVHFATRLVGLLVALGGWF